MAAYLRFPISLALSLGVIIFISGAQALGQNGGYVLTASPATVAPSATITVSWTAPRAHSTADWIGLFQAGQNDSGASVIAWQYVPGNTSGIMSFKSPNVITTRKYEMRYFLNNGFVKTVTSNPITVTQAAASSANYSLIAAPVTVVPGGSIAVSWKAPAVHSTTDWIGLFEVGQTDSGASVITWQYVPGRNSGTMSFKSPMVNTPHVYQMRYFLDNGFVKTATSNPVTVTKQAAATPPPATGGTTSPTPLSTRPSPTPTSPQPPSTTPPSTTPGTTASCPNGQQVAFPGAEGAGRCSQGGHGGPVITVTNLHDSGPGSLRECLEERNGPRTCRQTIAGWVYLTSGDIVVRHPFVTWEGGPGGVKGRGIYVRANHTVFRNVRIFPGLEFMSQSNINGITYWNDETGQPTHDHICEHCSIGWTNDDIIGIQAANVTIQDSLLYESLECSQCGGKGFLIQGAPGPVSVLRSVQAHTYIRWPEISGGQADFVNTIEYNSNGVPSQIGPVYGPAHINFVGNVFLDGVNIMNPQYQPIRTLGGLAYSQSSSIFVHDNIGRWWDGSVMHHGSVATPDQTIVWTDNGGVPFRASRYGTGLPLMATLPASQVLATILPTVGAMPRSASDARVIQEIQARTGRWRSDVNDAGGWPVLASGSGG